MLGHGASSDADDATIGLRSRHANQVDTPEFKRWFGASKVVDPSGLPLVVYHGTLREFSTFSDQVWLDTSLMGRGLNFSSDPEDASRYASTDVTENLDLTGKAAHLEVLLAKTMRQPQPGEAYRKAKAMVIGDGAGRVLPVFLSLQNPLVIGHEKILVDAQRFRMALVEADVPEVVWDHLGRKFQELESGIEQCRFLAEKGAQRVLRQVASLQNRDGMILAPEVAPYGRGATHYLAFGPTQVKSAIGNCGAFDPSNPDIRG